MNVNMNSIRLQATGSFNKLGNLLKDLVHYLPEEHQIDELIDAFETTASFIGFMNCVHDTEDENFRDLSEEEVISLAELRELTK